ncbi:hypothetical protein MMC12_007029 [Toensbergia leucococca]|nr:hypothetical protein [Toensbergia leucococca]
MSSFPDRPPPSTAAIAIATAILAALGGYLVGQASSLGLFNRSKKTTSGKESWPNSYDVTVHPDSSDEELMKSLGEKGGEEDEDEEEEQGELKSFEGNKEECKLVLVVRTDLGMGKGKIAAQCSHATLACYKNFLSHAPKSPLLRRWEQLGQAKVALQVKNEEELETLQAQAVSLGLCARVIHDAGRTQIASGSATVCGIGPGPKSVIDRVTGHLKLL